MLYGLNIYFETQDGLAQCWEYYKNSVTNLMFPRCHYIRSEAGIDAFVEDYITTALVSTLKIIVHAIENNKMIFSANGNVSFNFIVTVYVYTQVITLFSTPDTMYNY